MVSSFLDAYALLFSKRIFVKFNKFLFLLGCRGLGILNYKSPHMTGEEAFLSSFLKKYDHSGLVVVDVGANSGQFASWVARNTDHLKVISFEPNPVSARIYSESMKAFLGSGRLKLVGKGLSDKFGKSKIYDYPEQFRMGSQHSSMYEKVITDIHSSERFTSYDIDLTTLDQELCDVGSKICLLKIDVEGHELGVLGGGCALLSNSPPPAILLEFNEMNVNSGVHFKDFLDKLGDCYLPFRLLPGGGLLPLDGQSPLYTELYAFQNIVFLRR